MFDSFNSFIQNPMMYLARTKFNIPQNMQSPNEIINYLLQSGQLSQDQYNQVYSKYKDLESSGKIPQK